MDQDEEDLEKMKEFITKQKSAYSGNFEVEYQDFINFKQDGNCEWEDEDIDDDDEIENVLEEANLQITEIPSSTLTEEEQDVIDSCPDPDLKKLLVLNRSKNMQLMKLHQKMQHLLIQTEAAMEEKNRILKTQAPKNLPQQTNIWKLAAPYFKDKKLYSCPINSDAIKKRANKELSVYDLERSPRWKSVRFECLISAVKCNYNINRQNEVVQKISALKAKGEDCEEEKVLKLKQQLDILKTSDEVPPLNSNKFINWYKVSETFLRDRHTPLECQAVWHMLIHPSINKSAWSDEENEKLQIIAKRYNCQNWEAIAEELDNKRTAFTTCLHYFSKLCSRIKKTKFTREEDQQLLEAIEMHRIGNFIPWNTVVCYFEQRSRHQVYHRYHYFLRHKDTKKGKFSEAEDILLIILVNKFGRNFRTCAQYMPHRSHMQLKNRYLANLQRDIKKGTFTAEDDLIIYEHVQQHGERKWSTLETKLNRCNAQIRQRYKCIKAFKTLQPDLDIAEVPKRKHKYDDAGDQHSFLHYIADQFKDVATIPTVSMIEKSLEIQKQASPSVNANVKNIDEMLTDFFKSSMTIEKINIITDENLEEAAGNVAQVLGVLEANLDIPKDLQCGAEIDYIDVEILEQLSKQNRTDQAETNVLVAPNINTLVGLRSLIIKNKEYKQQKIKRNGINDKVDESCEIHRELFTKRFDKLLDWSAVLSLEKPNRNEPNSGPTTSNCNFSNMKTYTPRPAKKRKIDIAQLAQLPGKCKLVDRSVVENMMKNTNLRILKLDSMHLGGAVVVDAQPTVDEEAHNENTTQVEEDDEDLEDVQKLDLILNSIKSEKIGEEQFRANRDLDELLQCKKVSCFD